MADCSEIELIHIFPVTRRRHVTAKGLIICATRVVGNRATAEPTGESFARSEVEVRIMDAKALKSESGLEGYDAYLYSSAPDRGEKMPEMKQLLFIAERAGLSGKAGGGFEAYGWCGEAPRRIHDTMKNLCRMNMMDVPLRVRIQTGRDFSKKSPVPMQPN